MKQAAVVLLIIFALLASGCLPSNPDTTDQQTTVDLVCSEVNSDQFELRLIDTSGREEIEKITLSPNFYSTKYYPSEGEYLIGITTGENVIATANVDLISVFITPCESTHWIRAKIKGDLNIAFEFKNK